MQGWLAPRLPYFILYVLQPAASAISWLPRQMPKTGLKSAPSRARATARRLMSTPHCVGSPGPLEMKRPSYVSERKSWSHGTTSSSTPLDRKYRMMFAFMPQSIARIRMGLPVALRRLTTEDVYNLGTLVETWATRLSEFGSICGTSFSSSSSKTILPSIAPCSRIRLVRARVSIPVRPGTPFSLSHSPSDLTWFQWHESGE